MGHSLPRGTLNVHPLLPRNRLDRVSKLDPHSVTGGTLPYQAPS